MATVTFTISESNYKLDNEVTITQGDKFVIKGNPVNGNYGLSSYNKGVANLEGNYPPETPKNKTYWKTTTAYGAVDYVWFSNSTPPLNTVGTYTYVIGISGYRNGTLTLHVVSSHPTIPVNVNGSWKGSTPHVNVSGSWKEVSEAYVNVNGTWKKI